MKTTIEINTNDLVEEIARRVIQMIKPLLKNQQDDPLFTVDTLSEYLKVKPQWVYRRIAYKEIPYVKMGRFVMFRKSEIDRWLTDNKVPAANPLRLVK